MNPLHFSDQKTGVTSAFCCWSYSPHSFGRTFASRWRNRWCRLQQPLTRFYTRFISVIFHHTLPTRPQKQSVKSLTFSSLLRKFFASPQMMFTIFQRTNLLVGTFFRAGSKCRAFWFVFACSFRFISVGVACHENVSMHRCCFFQPYAESLQSHVVIGKCQGVLCSHGGKLICMSQLCVNYQLWSAKLRKSNKNSIVPSCIYYIDFSSCISVCQDAQLFL